jgi:putative DNA methylase
VKSVRRLIEVDLPIAQISAEARREKSIRHGHISTLHIWWARRPLAACRSVVLAALLPDPVDTACPDEFRTGATRALYAFRERAGGPPVSDTREGLRTALLSFIARFSAWESSNDATYLDCARALTGAAYPDGPPLVVDPFAGGGAIPLEALRVGADVWAGDYNPVATVLLKTMLEDVPRHGVRLADAVATWGQWIGDQTAALLGELYPNDSDGAIPIAYLWARTATCEGPGCGTQIPLIRQLWLVRKATRKIALRLVVDSKRKTVDLEIEENPARVGNGTVQRGSAVCPVCNLVTPVARVRTQAKEGKGLPVRMIAVVRSYPGRTGRNYRAVEARDLDIAQRAEAMLEEMSKAHAGPLSLVPDESLGGYHSFVNRPSIYGYQTWGDLFLERQAVTLGTLVGLVRQVRGKVVEESGDEGLGRAAATALAIAVDRQADRLCTLTRWHVTGEKLEGLFSRQAIPMVWDFAEANPLSGSTGDWRGAVTWVEKVCRNVALADLSSAQVTRSDARALPIPDDSVSCIVTDPPYYFSVQYADLSDFFYVWLRRAIGDLYPDLFAWPVTEKAGELIVQSPGHEHAAEGKNRAFYEQGMADALKEARRIIAPDGVAVIVFAHTSTAGWESMLNALVQAGWAVTGSWPLDTEMQAKVHGQGRSLLGSSVHIVCRPRAAAAGSGDWREVRFELERRIAEWLPRLSDEGVEGADAIFACIGPALEVFSRFDRVETAAGDAVPLSSPNGAPDSPAFLPAVWAAVAREALRMIFEGPEAEGFEEDARLTALWLWTLRAGQNGKSVDSEDELDSKEEAKRRPLAGWTLDFDTARKLAQALGVHLDDLDHPGGILEVESGEVRLLPLADRREVLLGPASSPARGGTLFATLEGPLGAVTPGATTLDRVQQAMLLFGDGSGDALRRVLLEPGYVQDPRFRRLAQALSSLYPATSQEKRWLDGLLGVMRQVGV